MYCRVVPLLLAIACIAIFKNADATITPQTTTISYVATTNIITSSKDVYKIGLNPFVNPPMLCSFTNQNAFIISSTNDCNQFTNTDGLTGTNIFITVPPTFLFLPMIVCATTPTDTFMEIFGFGICVIYTITGQTSVSILTTGGGFPITNTCPTTVNKLCIYPSPTTSISTTTFFTATTVTATVNVPTFSSRTTTIPGSFTFTTTRTTTSTIVTITTQTISLATATGTGTTTTTTVTFTEESIIESTALSSTTVLTLSTTTTVSVNETTLTSSVTLTSTTLTTTCPGGFLLKAAPVDTTLGPLQGELKRNIGAMDGVYPTPYNFRMEQAQCSVPFAGSVYNSNPGSSVSTICNVAGATQLITTYTPYYTWLWSMVKTWTPCAYAAADTIIWVGSTLGNCIALSSTTTVIRPCNEIHPVICINLTTIPIDVNQIVFTSTTTTSVIPVLTIFITRTSTITISITQSVISFSTSTSLTSTSTTTTSTRNTFLTGTITTTSTVTNITLTTTTTSSTETIETDTVTVTSAIATRTVTSFSTSISTFLTTTVTTETDMVSSCPITRTITLTIETTFTTVITNVVPLLLTTIFTTVLKCATPSSTTFATDCGCS